MRTTRLMSSGSFSQSDARNTLGKFVVLSVALHGVSLFALFLLAIGVFSVSRKAPPTLVQVEAGKSISVEPLDSLERTPASIQKFTQDTMTLLMSASGTLPTPPNAKEAKPVQDQGLEISTDKGKKRISSLAALAGFGLADDFRSEFLKKLGEITPQEIYQGSSDQLVLVVSDVSKPEKIEAGKWKVVMIATLIRMTPGNVPGQGVPFNKEIFIHAVTPPSVGSYSTDIEKEIAQIRNVGLEIYGMRDFNRPNL